MSTKNDWDRSTENSLRSGGLASLRPEPAVLDEAWMERTFATIVAEAGPGTGSGPRRPRPWHRLVVGATVVVAATGGVAAATGTAPHFVEQQLRWLQHHTPGAPQPTMSMIADVALPGNGRFTAWRGIGQGEMCSAQLDNWNGNEHSAGGMACGEIDPEAQDRDRQLFDYRFSPDAKGERYYPVVYGAPDDRPVDASVTHVRVHGRLFDGRDWHRDAVLDPATRGFGVIVPGSRPRSSLEAEWDTPSGGTSYWDSNLRSVVIDLLDDTDRLVRTITLFAVRPEDYRPRR